MAMMGRDDYAKAYSTIKSRKQKTQGVIYIEDISDKIFWEKIAFNHDVKLYSENNDKVITGKSKLLQICSANQLIAIDSDFDDLCPQHRPESILCAQNKDYILQTYAHGRENIVFSPKCLHEILDSKFKLYLDNHDNPILEIFEKLSEIWFESYRKFLFLFNQNQYQHNDWIAQIQFHNKECQEIALKQDFSNYVMRLAKWNDELNQSIHNQADFEQFCIHLQSKNFDKTNVWAFIHCHNFESQFVEKLFKEIVANRQNQEKQYVETQFSSNEINDQRKKIFNQFAAMNDIKTVLNHYFYDVYFPQAKETDVFLQKIVADYAKIIQA